MTSSLSSRPAADARAVDGASDGWRGGCLAVAALWVVVMLRLTSAWSSSLDLAHGWAVPVLCALVVWARYERAPARVALVGAPRAVALVTWVLGACVLAFALPVLEANRLWPTAQWLAALGAALGTIGLLALGGGVGWARHFVFPIFFATTALAWPALVQARLLDWLASANAQIAAEVASLAGHPAIATGNVIEVGRGRVGVDEACAGLRSLQAVWMLTWFLGELGRFGAMRRLALVGLGLALAVVGNVARATFLTLRVAAEGAGGNERWHDIAGNAAMVATFAAVLLAAWLFWRNGPRATGTIMRRFEAATVRAPAARWAVVATCVVVAGAEIGTRGWFGWRERAATGGQWALASAAGWQPLALATPVREQLRFSSADSLQWTSVDGTRQALAHVFRWEETGSLGTAGLGHDPTVCMPAIGARLVARPAAARLTVAGRELEFVRYRFTAAGRTQHVFYGVWDAFHGRPANEPELDIFWGPRVQRVIDGQRRADAAHVVFVWQTENDATDAHAETWLRETAPRLLRAN